DLAAVRAQTLGPEHLGRPPDGGLKRREECVPGLDGRELSEELDELSSGVPRAQVLVPLPLDRAEMRVRLLGLRRERYLDLEPASRRDARGDRARGVVVVGDVLERFDRENEIRDRKARDERGVEDTSRR